MNISAPLEVNECWTAHGWPRGKTPFKIVKRDPIVGIDPSLRSTGLCVAKGAKFYTKTVEPPAKLRDLPRLAFLRHEITQFLADTEPCMAVIEGYAFSKRSTHAHAQGEWGGLIRMACVDLSIPILEVPPTCLKKFIVGAGNAPKNVVLKHLFKRWKLDIDNDDEGDAAALALMGLAHAGLIDMTKKQTEAIKELRIQ